MDIGLDYVQLSRIQFAVTAMFHIIWPALTVGLSLFLVVVEILWVRTGRTVYYHHARFWGRLLLLNFGLGVVSGIPLEFAFGTNWAPFAWITGDFIGNILGFEAAMAFMLEAGFIGIMMFGWQRVPASVHLFSTLMVAFGASLSAFWIMAASAWMQTPAGVHLEGGRLVVDSYLAAIFNPAMPTSVLHMWIACLQTAVFVVGGISAWYLLRGRHVDFFLISFRMVVIAAVILAPVQILLGHASGRVMAEHQPAKFAASEAHWQTNPQDTPADWVLLAWPDTDAQRNRWELALPGMLGLLAAHDADARITGLRDFARDEQPSVWVTFYALRIMMLIGLWLLLLSLWTAWCLAGARPIHHRRALLRSWIATLPLPYIAIEMGWLLREVGRQPWTVQGLLRTQDSASVLTVQTVATSLLLYVLVYTLLFVVFVVFAVRYVRRGPDLQAVVPDGLSQRKPVRS